MTLVPSTASSYQVITVGFLSVPTAKSLCLFYRCSLATSASLWGKPGNARGFPHGTLGWVGSQDWSDHLALSLLYCWSSAQAPWWMRTPDLWATLRKANNVLPALRSSHVHLRRVASVLIILLPSFTPHVQGTALLESHIRDSLKLQPHLLRFFCLAGWSSPPLNPGWGSGD